MKLLSSPCAGVRMPSRRANVTSEKLFLNLRNHQMQNNSLEFTDPINSQVTELIQSYHNEIQAIYLFGSAINYQLQPNSDIDIALLLPHQVAKKLNNLSMSPLHLELTHYFQRDVDLINLREVTTVFQYLIVNRGKIIYYRDKTTYRTFEMLTWSFYQKLNEERAEILEAFFKTGQAYAV